MPYLNDHTKENQWYIAHICIMIPICHQPTITSAVYTWFVGGWCGFGVVLVLVLVC